MATVNKALKKRAQAFSEEHGLPYLRALKAVDEPLHQLRDLLDIREVTRAGYFPGFRLATADDRQVSLYADSLEDNREPRDAYDRFVAQRGLSRFDLSEHFYMELGRRLGLLSETHSQDIWRYRERHRAGLLSEDAPTMEPFFHHFGTDFSWNAESAFRRAAQTGIFGVSIASASDYNGSRSLIPLTGEEFEALKLGEPIEKIELAPIAGGSDDGAFYRLKDPRATDIELTRDDRLAAKKAATAEQLIELIGDLVEPFTKTERKFVMPVVNDLAAERRATVRELVMALRSAMNENQRALGSRLEAALEHLQDWVGDYGLDSRNKAIKDKIDSLNSAAIDGKPYRLNVPKNPRGLAELQEKQAAAGEIFKSLGFDEEELASAQGEVANEENRQSLIENVLILCSMVVSRFDHDYFGNREIVKAVVLGELRQGAQDLLQRVIRKLRKSASEVERGFGSRLLQGLAEPRSLEEASETQEILERMRRTEKLVTEYESVYHGPASRITDQLQHLGVRLTKSSGGTHYYGACPFHEDKGNLVVEPEGDRFSCRICNRAGDSSIFAYEWSLKLSSDQEPAPSGVHPAQLLDAARDLGVKLKKRPKADHYYGNCPFHEDHGNFIVSTVEDHFSCARCGRTGGAEKLLHDFYHWRNREKAAGEDQEEKDRSRNTWDKPLNDLIEENYS